MATTAKTLPLIATASSIALSRADPAPDQARLFNLLPGSGLRLPCQVTKVDLWLPRPRPRWNALSTSAAVARSEPNAWPLHCTGASPGASGAASSSNAAPS